MLRAQHLQLTDRVLEPLHPVQADREPIPGDRSFLMIAVVAQELAILSLGEIVKPAISASRWRCSNHGARRSRRVSSPLPATDQPEVSKQQGIPSRS